MDNHMIPLSEALQSLLNSVTTREKEQINFTQSLHRVLACDVFSDIDLPPFNKSAMDGFACRMADLAGPLAVVEHIPAGVMPTKTIRKGECAKIMTGGVVPQGADCVIVVEQVEYVDVNAIRFLNRHTSTNICAQGEDVRRGDLVLGAGTEIEPQHIAVLASVGAVNPWVYRKPLVAVWSTGTELVEPHCTPSASQIRNSNSYQLIAQCKRLGIDAHNAGMVADNKLQMARQLTGLLSQTDVVLITGGVSMGDHDYIPEVIQSMPCDLLFQNILIKPGKRALAAKLHHGQKWIIGLPGNPVSSFVLFEILVAPFLRSIEAKAHNGHTLCLPIDAPYRRKEADKQVFVPALITPQGTVRLTDYNGSAHIHAYTQCTHMMEIPIGCAELHKGDKVLVRQI